MRELRSNFGMHGTPISVVLFCWWSAGATDANRSPTVDYNVGDSLC